MARTQHRSIRMDADWLGLMRHARRQRPATTGGSIVRRLIRLYLTNETVRERVNAMPDPLATATRPKE